MIKQWTMSLSNFLRTNLRAQLKVKDLHSVSLLSASKVILWFCDGWEKFLYFANHPFDLEVLKREVFFQLEVLD